MLAGAETIDKTTTMDDVIQYLKETVDKKRREDHVVVRTALLHHMHTLNIN